MAKQLHDRFDNLPEGLLRIGAHRAAAKRGRGWIAFAWAALATGILVALGLYGLAIFRGDATLPFDLPSPVPTRSTIATPTGTPIPVVEAKVDPAVVITVLNGTPTKGLASAVGDILVAKGWNGAAEGVGSRTNAGASNILKTVVYYGDAAHESAARAMVLSLKVGKIRLSSAYPGSPITVVIGTDYKLAVG